MPGSGRNPEHVVGRRQFLAGVGVVAGAVAGGQVVRTWGRPQVGDGALMVSARAAHRGRTAVFLELAGGNDGLGTVVPHADPDYRRLRPTLAIDNPIDLDGSVGVHPSLAKLATRFSAGQVAIIEGVGYPKNDLSHFASLADWWTAQPGAPGPTGWLGRYLDATVGFDDPLAGIVIGPGPSPALVGERSFATSISDASGLEPAVPSWVTDPATLVDAWARLGDAGADRHTLIGQVRDSVALTVQARKQLDRTLAASRSAAAQPVADGSVVASLELAARVVAAAHPPKVVYVTNLGDFDTHQGQAARQTDLLRDLDDGIDRFFATVEAAGAADQVILVTLSEFGRRAQENGSGTDHGAANAHFVVGPRVKGGRYGRAASLADLDSRGNLPFGVDFRELYATPALEGWLGADAAPILGSGFRAQPIFT